MANLLKVENIRCLTAPQPIRTPLSFRLVEGQISIILTQGCSIAQSILAAIQGEIPVDAGKIVLAGDLIANPSHQTPAQKRSCSLVSANPTLIPHLSVADNIALAVRNLKKRERQAWVTDILEDLELEEIADLPAFHLSAVQRQRTALARALVSRPQLLLWEEPFAPYPDRQHLDLVDEIEQLVEQQGLTCLITSSSLNASFALAQQMAVFSGDRLLQWDSPQALYHQPAHREVARLTGNGVLLEGFVHPDNTLSSELGTLQFSAENDWVRTGKPIEFLLRPEQLSYDKRSIRCGTIIRKRFQGSHIDYRLRLEEGSVAPVLAPSHIDLPRGKSFCFRVEMEHLMVFRPGEEAPVDLGRAYSL
ncbi:MAG: ATP-binding cassette domain-containing protein [Gammaproteobacteria bacterium]|nr:ATP-binding cassette domain-containing protein [Gammaproteobacteria bacterium]